MGHCVVNRTNRRVHTMTENPRPVSDDDDTEGHMPRVSADAERPEGDDTEGHRKIRTNADAESAEGDDTEGHLRHR